MKKTLTTLRRFGRLKVYNMIRCDNDHHVFYSLFTPPPPRNVITITTYGRTGHMIELLLAKPV